jgi:hypothetical protein
MFAWRDACGERSLNSRGWSCFQGFVGVVWRLSIFNSRFLFPRFRINPRDREGRAELGVGPPARLALEIQQSPEGAGELPFEGRFVT